MSIKNFLARCSVVLTGAASKLQTAQVRLLAGEVRDNLEHFEPYGFTARPLPGAEGVVGFVGGDRSHAVVLCIADRRFRLTELAEGEVALYTDEGDVLHFKRGREIAIETLTLRIKAGNEVVIDTPLITATGRIESAGDQVAAGISQTDHVHGSSPTPS